MHRIHEAVPSPEKFGHIEYDPSEFAPQAIGGRIRGHIQKAREQLGEPQGPLASAQHYVVGEFDEPETRDLLGRVQGVIQDVEGTEPMDLEGMSPPEEFLDDELYQSPRRVSPRGPPRLLGSPGGELTGVDLPAEMVDYTSPPHDIRTPPRRPPSPPRVIPEFGFQGEYHDFVPKAPTPPLRPKVIFLLFFILII